MVGSEDIGRVLGHVAGVVAGSGHVAGVGVCGRV